MPFRVKCHRFKVDLERSFLSTGTDLIFRKKSSKTDFYITFVNNFYTKLLLFLQKFTFSQKMSFRKRNSDRRCTIFTRDTLSNFCCFENIRYILCYIFSLVSNGSLTIQRFSEFQLFLSIVIFCL